MPWMQKISSGPSTAAPHAYVPKDRIIDITLFLKDILVAKDDKTQKSRWFKRLESYFEKRFGKEWQKKRR